MPLQKENQRKNSLFTNDDLRLAISDVKENRSSLRQAALKYCVPKSTLSRYIKDITTNLMDPNSVKKKTMVTTQVVYYLLHEKLLQVYNLLP